MVKIKWLFFYAMASIDDWVIHPVWNRLPDRDPDYDPIGNMFFRFCQWSQTNLWDLDEIVHPEYYNKDK